MKKVLFIDRDGTLVKEPPVDYQLDAFEKLEFFPEALYYMRKIATELDYTLVMVTNQDGLGTSSFPEADFWPIQNLIMATFKGEGVHFDAVHIDKSLPEEKAPTRKPATGMLEAYIDPEQYDLTRSFVIGDRHTDIELAHNLNAKGILIAPTATPKNLPNNAPWTTALALQTPSWEAIYNFLHQQERKVIWERNTKETQIQLALSLDGNGHSDISTGIAFFDHIDYVYMNSILYGCDGMSLLFIYSFMNCLFISWHIERLMQEIPFTNYFVAVRVNFSYFHELI